jgi:ADP-ribose pyrophosphatase YjhB (NUDIX family)
MNILVRSGGDGDGDGFRDFPRAWVRMGETLAATASRAARDAFGVEGMLGDECVWIGGESETTGEGESILSMALKCTLTEVKAVTRIAASASWQSVSYAELLALAEATPSRTLAPQSTATFATALSASYDDNARSEL